MDGLLRICKIMIFFVNFVTFVDKKVFQVESTMIR